MTGSHPIEHDESTRVRSRSVEVFAAFIIVVLISLFLSSSSEVVCIASPHDDEFFVLKSIHPAAHWPLATIKELGAPLFFRLLRFLGCPFRVGFSLAFGLANFAVWWELRRWPFPGWLSWSAMLFCLFLPIQFFVFSRPTADPLSTALVLCLLAASLAIVRRSADKVSVVVASVVVALFWLDRPEGLLAVVPLLGSILIATLLRTARTAEFDFKSMLAFIVKRWAIALCPLLLTCLAVCSFNLKNYGIFAPTVMSAPPFQYAWRQLVSIDTGEPYQPCRPVSKRALELACNVSPSMNSTRVHWLNNLDGKGWSHISETNKYMLARYIPVDGSISGAVFQWALLDVLSRTAGVEDRSRIELAQKIGDELEDAFRKKQLVRRPVISPIIGPGIMPFLSKRALGSVFLVSSAAVTGWSPNDPLTDDNSLEMIATFNEACLRRKHLIPASTDSNIKVSGWIVNSKSPEALLSMSLSSANEDVSLQTVERPDVLHALAHRIGGPAPFGFSLTVPVGSIDATRIEVDGAELHEVLSSSEWNLSPGNSIQKGKVTVHVDSKSMAAGRQSRESSLWYNQPAYKQSLSLAMSCLSLIAAAGIVSMAVRAVWRGELVDFGSRLFRIAGSGSEIKVRSQLDSVQPEPTSSNNSSLLVEAVLVFSVICGLILIPRIMLLSALETNLNCALEPRYIMPASVIIWVWAPIVAGSSLIIFVRWFAERRTSK